MLRFLRVKNGKCTCRPDGLETEEVSASIKQHTSPLIYRGIFDQDRGGNVHVTVNRVQLG